MLMSILLKLAVLRGDDYGKVLLGLHYARTGDDLDARRLLNPLVNIANYSRDACYFIGLYYCYGVAGFTEDLNKVN